MAFPPYISEHLKAFRFLDQKHGAFGLPRTDRDLTVNHDPFVRALNRNLCHPMRQKCSKALMGTKSVNRFERRFPLSGKGPFRTKDRSDIVEPLPGQMAQTDGRTFLRHHTQR